jgi:hypothetical protein
MYSWELANFIKDRNYWLGGDDYLKATSIEENPQLVSIKYNAYDNTIEMKDRDGWYFKFNIIPYDKAKKQGLVKSHKK